jgi:hypothetical protein
MNFCGSSTQCVDSGIFSVSGMAENALFHMCLKNLQAGARKLDSIVNIRQNLDLFNVQSMILF